MENKNSITENVFHQNSTRTRKNRLFFFHHNFFSPLFLNMHHGIHCAFPSATKPSQRYHNRLHTVTPPYMSQYTLPIADAKPASALDRLIRYACRRPKGVKRRPHSYHTAYMHVYNNTRSSKTHMSNAGSA